MSTQCQGCGLPEPHTCLRNYLAQEGHYPKEEPMDEPRTLAERLDAAPDGPSFGAVLLGFMAAVDKTRLEDDDDD